MILVTGAKGQSNRPVIDSLLKKIAADLIAALAREPARIGELY